MHRCTPVGLRSSVPPTSLSADGIAWSAHGTSRSVPIAHVIPGVGGDQRKSSNLSTHRHVGNTCATSYVTRGPTGITRTPWAGRIVDRSSPSPCRLTAEPAPGVGARPRRPRADPPTLRRSSTAPGPVQRLGHGAGQGDENGVKHPFAKYDIDGSFGRRTRSATTWWQVREELEEEPEAEPGASTASSERRLSATRTTSPTARNGAARLRTAATGGTSRSSGRAGSTTSRSVRRGRSRRVTGAAEAVCPEPSDRHSDV